MAFGTPPFSSRPAGDGVFASMGVVGTLGTADTGGTSQLLPAAIDPTTGAWFVNNIGSTAGNPTTGTLNTLGTVGVVNNIVTGTIASATIVGGTFQSGTVVNNGGSVQIYDTSGSIANILTSVGTAAGQNAQLISGAYMSVPFTTTTASMVAVTDAGNYRYVSVHIGTQGASSTTSFQQGNDGTNFVSTPLLTAASTGLSGGASSSTSSNVMFTGALLGRYFRLNITGIVSGTTSGTVMFYTVPPSNNIITAGAQQVGGWNMGTIGTIGILANGTVTINSKPGSQILTYGTSGTSAIGTLVAAPGIGTSIYITSFSIDGDSSVLGTAEVILSFGTAVTGTAVLFRATLATLNDVAIMNYGAFPVSGGITNAPLTYLINSGAGSVSWNVTYFVQ